MIYLGSDHRGFKLKKKLKIWLVSMGYTVVDKGNVKYDPQDDFPDYALAVSEEVAEGKGAGILLCGSGGMALVANKVKGIRAVEVFDEERARHAKRDDNANIIAIPADAVGIEKAKRLVKSWLEAEFKREEKYQRRVRKIQQIEGKYFK
jgi:RpiB/LacA/LacB family sugar-phosphate isomerase